MAAFLCGLMGGLVKGAVGFALPLVGVSGMSMIGDPQVAIAALIVPAIVANIYQAGRQGLGEAVSSTHEFWRFIMIASVMIFLVSQIVPYLPVDTLLIILGLLVVFVALIQLRGVTIPPPQTKRQERLYEAGAGIFVGGMGGLGGFWGPMTVLYLTALQLERRKFIQVQGIVYLIGCIPLMAGYAANGILNAKTLPLSIAMILPVAIGMVIGTLIQDRLDQRLFKKLVLIVLCFVGLNLLRRGLF